MKFMFTTICVLCIMLLAVSPGWSQGSLDESVFYSKSWAVVIGINAYQNFPSLEYAANDATAVATRFKSMGFQVISLQNEQATKKNIMDVLTSQLPAKVGRNDRLIIFYAGHGAAGKLPTGEEVGFIIPTDAKAELDGQRLEIIGGELVVDEYETFAEKTNFISVDDIRAVSDTVSAKHILYILDGCYSGFLDPAAYSRLSPSRRIGKDLKVAQPADTSRSLIIEEPGQKDSQAPSAKATSIDSLKLITSRDTVQILTAGSSGEEVYEKSGHGVFTYYLLRGLDGETEKSEIPNSPAGDCVITVTELGNYLKAKVPEASNSSQNPLFNRISGEGEFIFIPPICKEPDPVDKQPPANDETWAKTEAYKGPKDSQYKAPTQVTVDPEDNLYVLDTERHRIFKFDKSGNALPVRFEATAVKDPWLPASLAVGSGGDLWVFYSWEGKKQKKDNPSGKVVIYKGDGAPAVGWKETTEPLAACSRDDGSQVPFPSTGLIALDTENNLTLVDQEIGVLTKCDRNGKFLSQGGKSESHKIIENVNRYKTVTNPQGLAVDLFGYIYVADTGGNGIQKYKPDGVWDGGWPNVKGDKPYFFNSPHGLAVDSKFQVYVADTENHRIKKYTSVNQKLLTYWGKKDADNGSKYGEFDTPMGVAVNGDSTAIYVADTGNKRVQKFVIKR